MTEKLFYKDAYLKNFTATVIESNETDGGFEIVLDKTAFFPEEGGQYSDKGTLGGVRVINVLERDGVIYHITEKPLTKGEIVEGEIDFEERFEKMQCHTAEHILSGLFCKNYGVHNVGFHLGAVDVTLDISAPLSWEDLLRIEKMANDAVFKNIPVEVIYPTEEQITTLEYRSKLDIKENLRIVNIGEYDSCACCAPHVAMTGEIGSIKILESQKLRGGMRIHFTAGKRALSVYEKMYENLAQISRALSVPKLVCAEAVAKALSDFEDCKRELKSARADFYKAEADRVEKTDGNLVLVYKEAAKEELRLVANEIKDRVSGYAVLLSGNDGEYKYVIATQNENLREEIKKINAALNGRGGGTPSMAEGSFAASHDDIKKYFT